MKVEIPYRQGKIALDVAPEHLGAVLRLNGPDGRRGSGKPSDLVREAVKPGLADFLGLPGGTLVVVNDGTRPTPTRFVLDAIGDDLERVGAKFIIATGAHRGPTLEECDFIFGSWYERFKDRVFVHDSRDMSAMEYYGKTSRGTELYLNGLLSLAGKVIVIGSVEPHYFAGYTGGRKGFLPGIAGYSSIEQNHRLALSDEARALKLKGNPVHEDLVEAARLVKCPVYSIMTVLDQSHEVDTVTAGGLEESFNQAVEAANRIFTVQLREKADIVVTAAPYPMDIDLYQSQKAIDNAKLALKKGGTMILVSSCRDGIGGEAFYRLLSGSSSPEEVLGKISEGYRLGYHKAAKMAQVFCQARVLAFTDMDDEVLRSVFITPVRDLQKALDGAISEYGKDCKVVFMPDGSVTVPLVEGA